MKSFLFSLAALALCGACSQNTGLPTGTIRLAFAVDSPDAWMTYSVTDGGVHLNPPDWDSKPPRPISAVVSPSRMCRARASMRRGLCRGARTRRIAAVNKWSAVRLRNGGGVRLTLRSGYSTTGPLIPRSVRGGFVPRRTNRIPLRRRRRFMDHSRQLRHLRTALPQTSAERTGRRQYPRDVQGRRPTAASTKRPCTTFPK